MKRILSIAFLLVFLYNAGGYYFFFRYSVYTNRKEIKHLIRSGLKDSDLTLITVTPSDKQEITWIKPGKEFRYRHEMYDIVKASVEKSVKKYYCIRDSKEKRLISEFIRNHARRIDKRIKTTLNPFILQNITKTNETPVIQVIYRDPVCYYKSVLTSNPAPPPWQA